MKILMPKNFKFYILPVFLFIFVSAFFAKVSFAMDTAGEGGGVSGGGVSCAPSKFNMLKIMNLFPTDLRSTTMLVSSVLGDVKPWYMSNGSSDSETMGCGNYIATTNPAVIGTPLADALIAQECPPPDDTVCKGIMNQFELGGGRKGVGSGYDSKGFANSNVAGSLLGYAYLLQNTVTYEPVPVNTAYFFKDYAAKLPIIGDQVYAQNEISYGHTLIDNILGIWKIFRNIAYAMMSIIMLWVGFAIITRKKISSQTVVNVQYALPKIVIALVMIAFSYPIGALITSLSWTLWNNSRTIIGSISGSGGIIPTTASVGTMSFAQMADGIQELGIGGVVLLTQKIALGVGGAGAMLSIISIVGIVIILFAIFASLKALWIYVKMVASIAVSPLQIALYALPGNDDNLEKWFKQMLAWGIGIFGMAAVNWLTLVFALSLILQAFTIDGNEWVAETPIVSGSLFNVFIVPLLLIFGFSAAIRVPNMVEELMLDKKGGKR